MILSEDKKHIERLHRSLCRYCLVLTSSPVEAEDLAQDTWIKAIRASKQLEHANLEAFLLRIAKNTWIDQVRRNHMLARIRQAEQTDLSNAQITNEISGDEMDNAFRALLKHLTPLQRAVFLLRDVFGFSSLETANWMTTTEGAIKAALHRARHSLASVREELKNGSSPPSESNSLHALIRAMTSAYKTGDIEHLISLVQNDGDSSLAIGHIQNIRAQNKASALPTQAQQIRHRTSKGHSDYMHLRSRGHAA